MEREPDLKTDDAAVGQSTGNFGTWAFYQQLGFIFIGSIMLDGGDMLRCTIACVPAYWVGYYLVMFRRAQGLTLADILFLRFGPLALFLFFVLIVPWLSTR